MGCEGDDLTEEHKQFIRDLSSPSLTVQFRAVPDIKISNKFSPRFGLNWVKLNSWNMTEFHTVINLDTGKAAGSLGFRHTWGEVGLWTSQQQIVEQPATPAAATATAASAMVAIESPGCGRVSNGLTGVLLSVPNA
jgi:hypothetical protein